MTTILIVLALLAVAVGVVMFATRRKPARHYDQRLEQDTAWNDPITPADKAPAAGGMGGMGGMDGMM